MTVTFTVGRRVPKNFFRQAVSRAAKFLTFQENMWILIGQAFKMSKKDCQKECPNVKMTITPKDEPDKDPKWKWEWKIIEITSPIVEDEELYRDKLATFYENTGAIRKALEKIEAAKADYSALREDKNIPEKSKVMSAEQFRKARDAGFGAMKDMSISKKLLEAQIITNLEWDHDRTLKTDRVPEDIPGVVPTISIIEAPVVPNIPVVPPEVVFDKNMIF